MNYARRLALSVCAAAVLLALSATSDRPGLAASPIANPVPAPIPQGDIQVQLQTVASGLTAPVWGTFAPGDTQRLFVADQTGVAWAVQLDTGVKTVFLDVTSRLVPLGVFGPGTFDERGLLGLAFHPNYATNGLVYTFTTEPVSVTADFTTVSPGTANSQSVVAEWQVPSPSNPLSVVNPDSRRELLRIDKPQFNHNGGGLEFGPDGLLYISVGDGGGADDQDGQPFIGGPVVGHGPDGNGQNTSVVLGKMLRIDPGGSNSANGKYGIPASNPFVSQPGFAKEIFAYGLRNPWRFSFDQLTGAMYIADVGQNKLEEIDLGASGANYGWRHKEGSFFFDPNGTGPGFVTDVDPGVPAGLTDPIAQYDHDEGLAIIGGFIYRSAAIPALSGKYVFGDFARTFGGNGRLFYLEGSQPTEFDLFNQAGFDLAVLGFGQDASGNIYVLANEPGTPSGTSGVVLKLASPPVGGVVSLLTGSSSSGQPLGDQTTLLLAASIGVLFAMSVPAWFGWRRRRQRAA